MPNWNQVMDEIVKASSHYDIIRRKYLADLSELTGRNTIIYYSGWLQKGNLAYSNIGDDDKNGFMTTIHKLDRSKGLDLILHTPGGDAAATESIVEYLRSMFGTNIRAIIPQMAMSAGTMIACSCKEIIMGTHSSLGPIDPQIGGIAAHGVVEEFQRAIRDVTVNPSATAIWQPIIAKYSPTLIGECEKAIEWSKEMVTDWLISGMLKGKRNKKIKADAIVKELSDHSSTKSHSRHLSPSKCKKIGLNIINLENNHDLQEAVLSVHHSCMVTLSATHTMKIIENQNGTAYVQRVVDTVGMPVKK